MTRTLATRRLRERIGPATLVVILLTSVSCKVERATSATDDANTDATDAAEAFDAALAETGDASGTLDFDDAAGDVRPALPCPWEDHGAGLKGGAVSWVGVDPRTPGIAFAVAGGLLSRSADDGVGWQRWSEREAGFGQLAFPRDDPKLILSTSGEGLIASTDGGLSFSVRSLQGFAVRSVFVPEATPQRVFVGTRGAGVLRSDDHGFTWSAFNLGVSHAEIRTLIGPPDRPDVVVAGTTLLNDNLGYSGAGQLLYSDNAGASWATALEGVGWGNQIVTCGARTMFAAVRKGLARSDDDGMTWVIVAGLGTSDVINVAVTPDCETVYAVVYHSGVYRSDDGGATAAGPFREGFAAEPTSVNANAFALDPADPNTLLLANYAGLFRSTDAAQTWTLIDSGNGLAINTLKSSEGAPGRVFASTWGTGVWRRENMDDTWERIPGDRMPRDFITGTFTFPDSPDRWFIGTTNELWRTEDAGASYTVAGIGRLNVFDMIALPSGDLIAATQTAGLMRSEDLGDTWAPSNEGLVAFPTAAGVYNDTRRLARSATGVLYVGTNGGGLYRSEDDGLSWTRTANDQGVEQVQQLEVDPGPPERLYAVVANRGVIRSDDGGETWSSGSTGLASLDISDIALDLETGDVYASTLRDGVFRSLDGAGTWSPLDRFCLPVRGFNALALVDDSEGRWLIGAASGNGVYRNLVHAVDGTRNR